MPEACNLEGGWCFPWWLAICASFSSPQPPPEEPDPVQWQNSLFWFEFIQPFSITPFHTSAPAHHSIKQRTSNHRLIKHIKHFTTYVEGLKSPQKIKLTLSLPVYCLHVFSPVKLIVNVDPQVFIGVHNLHITTTYTDRGELCLFPPEVNYQFFCFCNI